MTPTINVNLKPCDCGVEQMALGTPHANACASQPVPITCPIRRTVEMTVTLGEDTPDRCMEFDLAPGQKEDDADAMCRCGYTRGDHEALGEPAHPAHVTCTIGGETWAGSEVTYIDSPTDVDGDDWGDAMWRACRARWEIIKALMLGKHGLYFLVFPGVTEPVSLIVQRDAVFAALAKMARAEEALHNAAGMSATALRGCGATIPLRPMPFLAMAEADLAAYVSHLIATVGAL